MNCIYRFLKRKNKVKSSDTKTRSILKNPYDTDDINIQSNNIHTVNNIDTVNNNRFTIAKIERNSSYDLRNEKNY